MFNIIAAVIVSFIFGIAAFINASPKPTPQKPITIATPSSQIATSAAITKTSPPITPILNNDNNNSQLAKSQALKNCLNKVKVFKSAASKMGYQQSEIDKFVQIAEYGCNHPGSLTISNISTTTEPTPTTNGLAGETSDYKHQEFIPTEEVKPVLPIRTNGSVNCNQVGNYTSCSNGQSFNNIGNTTFGNNGESYQQVGTTTFGSDGSSYQRVGNTIFGSDGTSSQQVGNTTFGSNGHTCTKVGSSTFCN